MEGERAQAWTFINLYLSLTCSEGSEHIKNVKFSNIGTSTCPSWLYLVSAFSSSQAEHFGL